jgi:hypothetical protein
MCIRAPPRGQGRVVISGDEKKRAENEAAFRAANEQIRAAERELDPPLERVPYICECDDVHCREQIRLTAAEYERVRTDGATFAIARGHPTDGDTVEEHEQYLVVRKPDGGGEVARALDPRGNGA